MSLETLDAISMVKKPVRGAEIHIRFTALIIFSNSIALGGKVIPRVTGSFIFLFLILLCIFFGAKGVDPSKALCWCFSLFESYSYVNEFFSTFYFTKFLFTIFC